MSRGRTNIEKASIFEQANLGSRAPGITAAFRRHLNHALGNTFSVKICEFYGLETNGPDGLAVRKIASLLTDVMFFAPAIELCRTWPGSATLGLFNERNPWDRPHKGKSNHLLDVAFMWGNFNHVYDRKNWKVARTLAERVVSFTYNKAEVPRFGVRTGMSSFFILVRRSLQA
ncbi:hypothetical protein EDB81DRAFT_897148 [Dactylonectria macrodidyma]|uniref:Carboxylesterase type B domain-containing protein n=1 Tax=Dactylonectria macrodidyma TaxID=307937 RepID=A0A9P9JNG8_9HYPO|nr:hypothetical protein EDB81DRAFT_897148 [Dactylonectria macrodidyma]